MIPLLDCTLIQVANLCNARATVVLMILVFNPKRTSETIVIASIANITELVLGAAISTVNVAHSPLGNKPPTTAAALRTPGAFVATAGEIALGGGTAGVPIGGAALASVDGAVAFGGQAELLGCLDRS